MVRFLLIILVILLSRVSAADNFGGFGERLERINVAASYLNTAVKAKQEIKTIPQKYVFLYSEFAYKRFLKSQSQSDYIGILDIISPETLSTIVEKVMLTKSFSYDYLDHEYYFSKTPGIKLKDPAAIYANVNINVKDPCELSVWNAIFVAKGYKKYHFNSNCKVINDLIQSKITFTKEELLNIYYTFRDINGY